MRWLIKFLSGGILDRVLSHIERRQSSDVESERIAAGIAAEEIKAEMAARANAREIRLATAGFWEMRLITFIIAACFTSHLVLVTIDTTTRAFQGWCYYVAAKQTCGVPAFPSPFDEWEGAILLSFFGIYTVGRGMQTIAAAMSRRK